MSLQGPILIVADEPIGGMAQALLDAGAFPVVEAQAMIGEWTRSA